MGQNLFCAICYPKFFLQLNMAWSHFMSHEINSWKKWLFDPPEYNKLVLHVNAFLSVFLKRVPCHFGQFLGDLLQLLVTRQLSDIINKKVARTLKWTKKHSNIIIISHRLQNCFSIHKNFFFLTEKNRWSILEKLSPQKKLQFTLFLILTAGACKSSHFR